MAGRQMLQRAADTSSVTVSTAAILWATVLLGQTAPLFTWQFFRV